MATAQNVDIDHGHVLMVEIFLRRLYIHRASTFPSEKKGMDGYNRPTLKTGLLRGSAPFYVSIDFRTASKA
jgi:hypothetical protein